jgi:hypothetical protein
MTPTPAKVARIGASHPREAIYPEPSDPPMRKSDMAVALTVWAVAPILAILLGCGIASAVEFFRNAA